MTARSLTGQTALGVGLAVRQNHEGAIGLTHRSCFRVKAVPTLATKRSYDSQDHFGQSPVFEGKKTGEKGGRQVAQGALVVGMRNVDHYQWT